MRIEFCVGIDLGSTTTKAVVLDPDRQVLGRGITNSRSNYDVACQVALGEALIHARFSLIDGRLSGAGVDAERRRQLLTSFELAFRHQQYLGQLQALVDRLHAHAQRLSAGQLMILREVEKATGRPGGFIESDLVDPRYFSASNIKNRLESYFQMIEQKRQGS